MTQLKLLNAGMPIQLGDELGSGGEGSVFGIPERPNEVAKIYASIPDSRKQQKLKAMVGVGTPAILNIAAWPLDILTNPQGIVRGITMPRVKVRRDIHELYSPKSRSETFPEADFRFITHVATNIARVFAVIHENGHVIGDVNHGNVLVGADGMVTLIDCDSFQVRAAGTMFTCDVGVPLFTPPELHGKSLRGLERTQNHDRFGLAILLFHLLFMGRHPFAGRYSGPGEMSIEQAISEYRFAYIPGESRNGMSRPPGTIPLQAMGNEVTSLFLSAFGRLAIGAIRPESKTWVSALERLKSSLRACSKSDAHFYPNHLTECPWCLVETQTGIRLFGQRIEVESGVQTIDVASLWQSILAVPDPGGDPPLPSEKPWSPPQNLNVQSKTKRTLKQGIAIGLGFSGLILLGVSGNFGILGLLLSIIAFGSAIAIWPRVSKQRREEAERSLAKAKIEWDLVQSKYKKEASRQAFANRRRELEKIHSVILDLPDERRRRLAAVEEQRLERQRYRYLNRFRIEKAGIPHVGVGRIAMLASYGVETAADVTAARVSQIPGFGSVLTSELVFWRTRHEQNFIFNPNEPINRQDLNNIDRELELIRQQLISGLRKGPAELRQLNQEITLRRQMMKPILERTYTEYKIAETIQKSL